jgi:hypothetical protein
MKIIIYSTCRLPQYFEDLQKLRISPIKCSLNGLLKMK